MSRAAWVLCFAILVQAMPSWGYERSVVVDGEEWLQPKDFEGYTHKQVSEVCPSGLCAGTLPGHGIDLSGFFWASTGDVQGLFAAYTDKPILGDFKNTHSDLSTQILYAMLSEPRVENRPYPSNPEYIEYEVYTAIVLGNGISRNEIRDVILSNSHDDYPDHGAWFWRPLEGSGTSIWLEEPIHGEVHSGIGNLRGWAISDEGIDRVEIYIDGKYMYDAPYGGERSDVGEAYPDVDGSDRSGFSLAFGYSNLGIGEHTVTARAFSLDGESKNSTATFTVVAFHKDFINKNNIVDTSQASMMSQGDEILLEDVTVDEQVYDLRLKWRTAEQGFEIIDIR